MSFWTHTNNCDDGIAIHVGLVMQVEAYQLLAGALGILVRKISDDTVLEVCHMILLVNCMRWVAGVRNWVVLHLVGKLAGRVVLITHLLHDEMEMQRSRKKSVW